MKTAELIDIQGVQVVKLPEEFRFHGPAVSIRKAGDSVILEPLKPETWPPGFFDEIKIEDAAFTRPEQGHMPPAPLLD
jgi:virulence-associated protein VagC